MIMRQYASLPNMSVMKSTTVKRKLATRECSNNNFDGNSNSNSNSTTWTYPSAKLTMWHRTAYQHLALGPLLHFQSACALASFQWPTHDSSRVTSDFPKLETILIENQRFKDSPAGPYGTSKELPYTIISWPIIISTPTGLYPCAQGA